MSTDLFEPGLGRIFLWVLSTSLAATFVVVLAWLCEVAGRRILSPRVIYLLWTLVALRLLWPFSPPSQLSVYNLRPYLAATVSPTTFAPEFTLARTSEGSWAPSIRTREAPGPFADGSASVRNPMRSVLGISWLVGMLGFGLIVFVQDRRLAVWVRRQPSLVTPRLSALLQEACELLKLRSKVQLIATDCLATPALFGFFRPCLLLPRRILETLTDEELRLIMLHELVHVRRRDVLSNWLMIGLQAIHWFNPAVWYAFRRLRAARELLCDATVLTHLSGNERYQYGQTLIKLFDFVARPSRTVSSVSILNHKSELQRRITMISNYLPTKRRTILLAVLLIATVVFLTFTSAATRKAPTKAVSAEIAEARTRASSEAQAERKIAMLVEQLATIGEVARRQQIELDDLQIKLGIPSYVSAGDGASGGPDSAALQRLEAVRIETHNEFRQINNLYSSLRKLNREDLRKALPTAYPDQQLLTLLSSLATTEQKLAHLVETSTAIHPEVKSQSNVAAAINRQINECLDGIIAGLAAKHKFTETRLNELEKELDQLRAADIDRSVSRRTYFNRKRELENTLRVRDRIQIQLLEAKYGTGVNAEERDAK